MEKAIVRIFIIVFSLDLFTSCEKAEADTKEIQAVKSTSFFCENYNVGQIFTDTSRFGNIKWKEFPPEGKTNKVTVIFSAINSTNRYGIRIYFMVDSEINSVAVDSVETTDNKIANFDELKLFFLGMCNEYGRYRDSLAASEAMRMERKAEAEKRQADSLAYEKAVKECIKNQEKHPDQNEGAECACPGGFAACYDGGGEE